MSFRFLVIRVFTAAPAELLELQTIRSCLLVLRRHVIAALTIAALQYNVVPWHNLFPISDCQFPICRPSPSLFFNPSRFSNRQSAIGNRQCSYSTTSDTVPAPTVRPPSRIAKRKPFSIAIGAINSISICTLSPGITISTPVGKCATPVTSVVRK